MSTSESRVRALDDTRRLRRIAGTRLLAILSRWSRLHDVRWHLTSRQDKFAEAYEARTWESRESGSGTGSELRATGVVRERLPQLLAHLGADTLLDAPCGDWNWMQHVKLPVQQYFGVDIVPDVIEANRARFGDEQHEFSVADLTHDALPRADAVLCRDCLVHASFQDIAAILENFRSTGATWLLLNTYPEVRGNRNQFTGKRWRRLNFRLPPFGFPEPLEVLPDGGEVNASQLAVWRLQELPRIQASYFAPRKK